MGHPRAAKVAAAVAGAAEHGSTLWFAEAGTGQKCSPIPGIASPTRQYVAGAQAELAAQAVLERRSCGRGPTGAPEAEQAVEAVDGDGDAGGGGGAAEQGVASSAAAQRRVAESALVAAAQVAERQKDDVMPAPNPCASSAAAEQQGQRQQSSALEGQGMVASARREDYHLLTHSCQLRRTSTGLWCSASERSHLGWLPK